jgi:MFS family permease
MHSLKQNSIIITIRWKRIKPARIFATRRMTMRDTVNVLLCGMLALAMSVGLARFGFTPLLPLMQAETGLTSSGAGWLAAANYVGYLTGAVWAGRVLSDEGRHRLLAWGLAVTALSLAPMALTSSPAAWMANRFVSGLTSAWVFVAASALVVPYLHGRGRAAWDGWHFGGVGLGMAVSGLTVAAAGPAAGSGGGWLTLAGLAAAMSLIAWRGLAPVHGDTAVKASATAASLAYPLGFLVAAYGCHGFGYIVAGTFLVAQAKALGLDTIANWLWVLAGAANLPSPALWSWIAARTGFLPALIAAHLLLIAGIAATVLLPDASGLTLGAALFGLTFMGITGTALSMGPSIVPAAPGRVMGHMTVALGVGQMLGPLAAAELARGGDYSAGLALSAAVSAAGLASLLAGWRLAIPASKPGSGGVRQME